MMQHPPPKTFVYNFSRDWFLQHRPMIGPGNEHYSDREQLASLMKPGESDDLLSRAMQHLFGSCFKVRNTFPLDIVADRTTRSENQSPTPGATSAFPRTPPSAPSRP